MRRFIFTVLSILAMLHNAVLAYGADGQRSIPNTAVINNLQSTVSAVDMATSIRNPSQEEIEKQLYILSQWTEYKAFQQFLIWLPQRWKLFDLARPALNFSISNSAATPNIATVSVVEKLGAKGTFIAHLENNLTTPQNAFTTRSPGDQKADPTQFNTDFAIFFRSPCLNSDLPEPVFETAAASFLNGFVTQMVLAEFEDAMVKADPGKRRIPDLPSTATTFPQNPHSPFEAGIWANDVGFDGVVTKVLTATPIQGDATLCGWYAGQQLAHSDKKYRDAAKALLKMRLDTRRVGQIVGYTLSYLSGYAANQIEKKAATDAPGSQGILDHLGTISRNGAMNVGEPDPTNAYGQLNTALFSVIVAAFAQSAGSAGSQSQAEGFRSLLLGFNQGTVRSAEVVYADTYLLAYGVGYADGFRDGYSKGYAEGYRAGYSAGWSAAPRSFFTGLDGFLGDLGKVVTTVVDVVGIIASFF